MYNETIYTILDMLGTDATEEDALKTAHMADLIAEEQGEFDYDVIDWIHNRTYPITRLWEAANGDVSALAEVRAEAHLPVIGS